MHFSKRVAVFVIGTAALCGGRLWLDYAAMPREAASVAVESVNGSDTAAARARTFGPIRSAADDAAIVLVVALAAACFAQPAARWMKCRTIHPKGDSRA